PTLGTANIAKAALGITIAGTYNGSTSITPTAFTTNGLVNSETITAISSATVNNTNVAGNGTNYVTGITIGGGTASMSNYAITTAYNATSGTTQNTATINAKALTVTANDVSTTYGTAVSLGTSAYTLTGSMYAGDTITGVTLSYNSANTVAATTNVGGYNASIIPSAATGSGLANYSISYVAGNLSVARATLTLTPNAVSTAYTGNTLDNAAYSQDFANYAVSGYKNTDTALNTPVTFTGSMNFAGSSSTVVKNAATYSLTAGSLAGTTTAGNYNIVFSNPSSNAYVINPVTLSVAATKPYDGSSTFAANQITVTTGIGNETLTLTGNATANSANVTEVNNLNTTGLTLGNGFHGGLAANYRLPSSTGSVTISPLNVAVSINAQTKEYDSTTNAVLAAGTNSNAGSYTLTGFISGEGAYITQTAGQYDSATVAGASAVNTSLTSSQYVAKSGTNLSNYVLPLSITGSGSITRASLTIIASDDTKFRGNADPTFGYVIDPSQFKGSDNASNALTSIQVTRPAGETAGDYVLTPSASAANYTIIPVAGKFTIIPDGQMLIKVANNSIAYGTLTSGNLAANTSASASYCQISSDCSAPYIVNLTLTPTSTANTWVATDSRSGSAQGNYTISVIPPSLTSSNNSSSGYLNVGNYVVTPSTNVITNAGYSTNYNTAYPVLAVAGMISVTPLALTVNSPASPSKVYDTTTTISGQTLTASNVIGSDKVFITAAGNYVHANPALSANVGTSLSYTLDNFTLSGADKANYVVNSSVSGTNGIITAAPVTIGGLSVNNKTYDATYAATVAGTAVANGLLGSDTTTVLGSATATFNQKNVADGIATTVDLSNMSLGNSNYAIARLTAPLVANIGKATLTVNGVNTNVTYNGSAQTNSAASIVGRQGSDDFTISGYGTGTNASNTAYADNLAVSPVTGTLASNYNVVYNNGGLTIGKAVATVAANKTYDATTGLTANQVSITGIGGAALGFTVGNASLSDANVTTANKYVNLGTLALTAGGAGTSATSNYVLPSSAYGANNSATVGVATLTVNGVNTNVTYNGSAQTNSAASIVGRQGSDDFTISGYGTGTNASNTAYADNLAVSPVTGTLASNYNVVYNNGGLTIGKAVATVAANKTYDATTGLTANQVSITGIGGAALGFTVGNASLSDANVTTANKYVNLGTLALTAGGAGTSATSNYVLPSSAYGANNSATVGVATLTVNGVNTNVTYNGSAQTNSAASIVGRQGSDDFTISGYGTGTNASNTAYADNLAVSPVTGTLASNYNVVYNNGGLTIGKANLNVTGNLIYNGTASVLANSLVATGVNGETFSISGTADLRSKNVQTNQQLAGVNGLVLSPNGSILTSNYNPLSVANTHISVTPLAVSLTAPTINKVYDGSYNYTMTSSDLANLSSQLVGGDAVTTASVVFYSAPSTTNGKDVGSNKQVILLSATISDGNNGSNYNVSLTPSTTSQITPAPLTIAAVNSAKFVGQITDPVGYSGVIYKGMVNGENPLTVLSGSPTYVRSDSSNNAVGSYALTPSGYGSNGSTNGNYQITYQAATFTIVPAQYLIVSVAPTSSTYGSAPSYSLTAQYLPSTNATPVYLGTVGTNPSINPIPLTTSGTNPITVSDGAGGGATFSIAPSGATLSGSQNVIVGAYNIAANSFTPIGTNFLGTQFVGSLTVTPKPLTGDQLGITGISRTYNGSSAIVGNTLNTNPTLSAVLSGDKVSVVGAGYFNDPNVGVNKTITLSVSLAGTIAGNDSGNYSLSSPQIISNTGTITQLSSVTYMGASGGNWSNASNWAGGAIPTLNNVANVVIPAGSTVVFDTPALTNLMPTSTITNNGVFSFASASNFTLNNVISGTGSLNQSGAGTLTIAGANSYSGGTNINASSIIVDNASALGGLVAGPVTSNGGTLSVTSGIQLPSLTVNGPIHLATNIDTASNQTYNGALTLVGNSSMTMQSGAGNIVFNGGLLANNQQSLVISALNGSVSFNNTVGTPNIDAQGNHIAYSSAYFQAQNIFALNVSSNNVYIRGNITTFGPQNYNGHVYIGDNGTNGRTRILLSEDPSIVFQKAVDDELANTHNLVVQAISTVAVAANDPAYPFITFAGAVGGLNPLASLTLTTGVQKQTNALLTDISPDPATRAGYINVMSTVNTAGNQTYTTNVMNLGDPALPNAPQSFTTNGGVIAFNLGAPAGGGGISSSSNAPVTFNLNGGSLLGLNSSGINYQVIPGGNTPAPVLSLPVIRDDINVGTLLAHIETGRAMEYVYSDGEGSSGAVSVTSPDSSCNANVEDCLKVNPLKWD
ncbi:hypothetical protein G6652_08860, partial [Polynucleobacter paneuropaeus]|nr:hypothetical protein [Polynucleobacter paneuropaeus]